MKNIRWLSICATLLALFRLSQQALAEASQAGVQVTLHKLLFPDGQLPKQQQDTGEKRTLLQNYRGLNDVTYQIYDVADLFYQLRSKEKTIQETQRQLVEAGAMNRRPIVEDETQTINGEDGMVSFSLASKDSQRRDKAYSFAEAETPEVIKERVNSLVVILPAQDPQGQSLAHTHLYLKNEEDAYDLPLFEKMVLDKQQGSNQGKHINYQLTTQIPVNILEYQGFRLSDKAGITSTLLPESIKVKVTGKTATTSHTLATQKHGSVLDFSIEDLRNFANQTTTVLY